MRLKIALFLLIALITAACSDIKGSKEDFILKVGDVRLTKEEVQAELDTVSSFRISQYQGPEGLTRFIEELAEKQMLFIEARKKELEKESPYKKRYEEARKEAEKTGAKKVRGAQPWERSLLVSYFLEKEFEKSIVITDKDLMDYYDSNNYKVRVSEIVVPDRKAEKEVFDRLKRGEDFGKVAAELSIDKKTAKKGGDIGYFSVLKGGNLPIKIQRVVAILNKGDVGGPVRMGDGLHILKATDKRRDNVKFEEVKNGIYNVILNKKKKEVMDNILKDLKPNYKIEIKKDALEGLVTKQPHPV